MKDKFEVAISALQFIANPIKRLEQQLKKDEKLDGYYASLLSNDAKFLKDIAKKTLEELKIEY